ncbi:hypothetical protein CEXT_240111 [Caerostris extrusa]|uniref:Uncharacterized protein n=1 Tax=Caerostris extrusa TaxID=172846 RepID=A0AAV4PT90_CAEEX|nr:hypothetical protein CEXT_240111 [Caerostris extrusa]
MRNKELPNLFPLSVYLEASESFERKRTTRSGVKGETHLKSGGSILERGKERSPKTSSHCPSIWRLPMTNGGFGKREETNNKRWC